MSDSKKEKRKAVKTQSLHLCGIRYKIMVRSIFISTRSSDSIAWRHSGRHARGKNRRHDEWDYSTKRPTTFLDTGNVELFHFDREPKRKIYFSIQKNAEEKCFVSFIENFSPGNYFQGQNFDIFVQFLVRPLFCHRQLSLLFPRR